MLLQTRDLVTQWILLIWRLIALGLFCHINWWLSLSKVLYLSHHQLVTIAHSLVVHVGVGRERAISCLNYSDIGIWECLPRIGGWWAKACACLHAWMDHCKFATSFWWHVNGCSWRKHKHEEEQACNNNFTFYFRDWLSHCHAITSKHEKICTGFVVKPSGLASNLRLGDKQSAGS